MSELRKKVFKHLGIQTFGRIIFVILGLLVISLMMRYLGPQNYGYYSIAIAFLQIFGIVADFGLYLITLQYLGAIETEPKEKQQEKTDYVMGNLFAMRFFLALIFYGLAVLVGFCFPFPLIVKVGILILSLSLFFCTLIQHLSALYQKMFETQEIFKGEVLGRIILLGLMLLFVVFNFGFYYVLLSFGLANFINFLVLYFYSRRLARLRFRFDFLFWREVLGKVWPIGLAIVLNVIYFKADTLILFFYRPAADVGYYGAAYRVFEALIAFPSLFLGLVLPQLAKTWLAKEKENFRSIFQRSFDFLVMISIPFVFGSLAVGREAMIVIGGPQFGVAGEILKVISLAAGILFVGELFKQAMIILNKQKNVLPFYLINTVVALIGYFIFIPLYSYWGAAWVTFSVELLMFVIMLLYFYKQTGIMPQINFLVKSFFSGLIMFIFLFLFKNLNLFILAASGISLYLFILFLIGGLKKQEIEDLFEGKLKIA